VDHYELLRDAPSTVDILIYETESVEGSPADNLLKQAERLEGVTARIFGQGQHFEGYGSKYAALYPILNKMDPEKLVVITDGRDVLVNNPTQSDTYLTSAVEDFRAAYDELTYSYPEAIVVSAEAQCCVSALTHASPGAYYNADGSRNERSCSSGEKDCLWGGEEKALPWQIFMKELAHDRNFGGYEDMYLNAGLMAGKVKNLLQVIEAASIGKDEDDQAVLTDFMYKNPDKIVLDYAQTMFGNNRGGLGGMEDGSCTFKLDEETTSEERLVHSKTGSSPLFLHSPGGFYKCHDYLSAKLGNDVISKTVRRQLGGSYNNYGKGIKMGDDETGYLRLGIGIDYEDWMEPTD